MLFEKRFASLRPAHRWLFACSLPLLALSAGAQDPASSSSSRQTGTTAAPGTAPIRSRATAQQIAPVRVATYDEKFELYGGINLMNGQAGQNLPKRYNMGGGEVMGTYWLGPRLGIAANYRLGAGTTDLIPQPPLANTRALVIQNIFSGGVNFRGPKNRYAAIDFHALAGGTHGTFDHSIKDDSTIPAGQRDPAYFGLYNNSTSPWGAVGASLDFNVAPRWAVRFSPDLTFEHFGTETREFFALSGGVVYRFGKR